MKKKFLKKYKKSLHIQKDIKMINRNINKE